METDAQPQEPQEPEQVENPRLVAAIAELASKPSNENWRRFYQELMESTFLLVAARPPGDRATGEPPPVNGPPVTFVALRDDAGQVIVPAFTDAATLQTWAPAGHPWMVASAPDLLREIVKNPDAQLEINRRCPGQWRVTHDEIAALARGEVPPSAASVEVLEEMILRPQTSIRPLHGNWPAELTSVISNVLVVQRPVVDAYAFEFRAGNSNYAVVGLRFTEQPSPALFAETSGKLLELARKFLAPGQSLACMALNQRDVLARVAESVEPFFARR